jgi:hypothetical protein
MTNLKNTDTRGQIGRRNALKTIGFAAIATSLGFESAQEVMGAGLSLDASDISILDFALNLEYLEAQYYSYALTGAGIDAQGVELTGRGKQGTVTVPAQTKVNFTDSTLQQYATEVGADEIAHVNFLRGVMTSARVRPLAMPAIDLTAFGPAAAAAGLPSTFTPFDNETDFLLGAFLFEDVGVTAYHGAAPLIANKTVLAGASGIMGTEAYHGALLRNQILAKGAAAAEAAGMISTARDTLGGEGTDQGVYYDGMINIAPTDPHATVFSRTVRLVLNIVYLGVNARKGGFFPNGING